MRLCLLTFLLLAPIKCAMGFTIVKPPTTGFYIYYGPRAETYTNRTWVGAPKLNSVWGTNLNSPANQFYAVTVTNRVYGSMESDPSLPLQVSNAHPTLTWTWSLPNVTATNIVRVSANGNSLTLTNPAPLTQFWRLRGLSWTNAELLASDNVKGPWVVMAIWNYPSNRTPNLVVEKL